MKNILNSIFAGLSISLGGLIFLSCENRTLGAFLFSVGLFSVLVFGFDLFTGKVCYFDYLKKPKELLMIYIGNFIGTFVLGTLTWFTDPELVRVAKVITGAKLMKKPFAIWIDAVICGICIAVAVKGYKKAQGSGKYLAVILGVMTFILCGAEHVVADMFYFVTSGMFSLRMVEFIVIVTVGNIIGGAMFSWIGEDSK